MMQKRRVFGVVTICDIQSWRLNPPKTKELYKNKRESVFRLPQNTD